MTRDHQHAIVYGAFGLLLGAKIVEVLLSRSDTGFIDWWLLLIGVGAAIVHYLPVTEKSAPADDSRNTAAPSEDAGDDDTLVLRDHPYPERGRTPGGDPAAADGDRPDPFL